MVININLSAQNRAGVLAGASAPFGRSQARPTSSPDLLSPMADAVHPTISMQPAVAMADDLAAIQLTILRRAWMVIGVLVAGLMLACFVCSGAMYSDYTGKTISWMSGQGYSRDDYQWPLHNTRQNDSLYQNGNYISCEAGGTYDLNLPATLPSCSNILIGIVDTGMDTNHQDLGPAVTGISFDDRAHTVSPGVYADNDGHGTMVAGIIAGHGLGVQGVVSDARLVVVSTHWATTEVVNGIYFCVTNGCRVINLSWGESVADVTLSNACQFAADHDVIICCASPNSGVNLDSTLDYPSSFGLWNVLTATSLNRVGLVNSSAFGSKLIGAPGRNVISCWPGNTYCYGSGSSFATAHLTGVVASLRARYPQQSASAIIQAVRAGLIATSESIAGRLDASRALAVPVPAVQITNGIVQAVGLSGFQYTLQESDDLIHWQSQPNQAVAGINSDHQFWRAVAN